MKNRAVVLLSGGLDSTTTLAIAINEGFHPFALTFSYGQRHNIEVKAAQKIAAKHSVAEHMVLPLSLDRIGGSALTDDTIEVPKKRNEEEISSLIPETYVPARNLIFLSIATAWAEVINATDIYIGVNAVDYSGYPDCRPEFIESFAQTARLGTAAGTNGNRNFSIHTPLSGMSKADIIKAGISLGVDYSLTVSCYDPVEDFVACGACDSCILRKKGFAEADVTDPTEYSR